MKCSQCRVHIESGDHNIVEVITYKTIVIEDDLDIINDADSLIKTIRVYHHACYHQT